MTLDGLVYVQVFCADSEAYYPLFNGEYRKHFSKRLPPPPHAFYGVKEVYGGARFEIQGIAVRRPE